MQEEHEFPDLTYVFNENHRNGSALKSQWTVTKDVELSVFSVARDERWMAVPDGWGVYVIENRAEWVGRSADGERDLFIARFRGQENPSIWHGYPGDPFRRTRDVPVEPILRTWADRGWIRKKSLRLLLQGVPCGP